MRRAKTRAMTRRLVLAVAVGLLALGSGAVAAGQGEYALGDIPLDPATYQSYLKLRSEAELLEALPSRYDAREEGLVTPPRNQGNCGACWAFASAGAMESHMLKQFGFGPTNLSEQQQVSCNTSMNGCGGGNSLALLYWETKGPLYESCFPYTASDTTACIESQCNQLDFHVVDWHTVPPTPNDFKHSLYTDGPSYWRYEVYDDFYTFWGWGRPGEVYVNSSSVLVGGHGVLLIGWDDEKQAYLCKNSWGTGGPNNDGTFWIAYSGHRNNLNFGMTNFSLHATLPEIPGPLVYSGYSTDAENGHINCGDAVGLTVMLKNEGNTAVEGISSTLEPISGDGLDDIYAITNLESGYPDITGGAIEGNLLPFAFSVKPMEEFAHYVDFELALDASNWSGGPIEFRLPILCAAAADYRVHLPAIFK